MPELRKDPITGRWVIISTERRKRPSAFRLEHVAPVAGHRLPVLRGQRGIHAARGAVVPPERRQRPTARAGTCAWCRTSFRRCRWKGSLDRQGEGLFDKMNGVGAHEVIIETPRPRRVAGHAAGGRDRARAVGVSRARARPEAGQALPLHPDLQEPRRRGRRVAGSPALQLIALPVVPRNVRDEIAGARRHFEHKERCVYCDIVRQELDQRARVISRERGLRRAVAVRAAVPVRDVAPAEAPRVAASRTRRGTSTRALARMLKETLQRMNRALESPPFNLIIHSAPFTEAAGRVLPLAPRDHAEADEGGRLRVGDRVLHQPDGARRSGAKCSAKS